ncbi:protein kinase domain-containing protein [Streptomyces profundus]|uniref:serine/threonine-protein kinase n=1 Tax=Streptomyces profundus TaxID=2867410 RepID=UPI001D162495|nr:serine/threonine-protein kinase [Streptomyces sp. MA3_2.13]UED86425.1 serine/threonine-protein kinase [Streptomyces sp. MA3_2.13]
MLRELRVGTPAGVGPYRLLALLGAGGMGEVYLGTRDGELAAVKTVRRELAVDGEFRVRFRREVAAARAVRHPRVAQVLGGDAEAAQPWLATEYVPGPTLQEAVARGGPLPVPVVRRLGVDLARALAAVHGAGLVHRDVKPGNVLLAAEGPRLIDFGIARATDASTLTATGKMIGSPGFMSPEHVAGGRQVRAASDVFCLGAVLCFAATGTGPFGEAPLAVLLYRIAEGEADLSAVPDELRATLTAALHPDPARRPGLAELVAAFDGAQGAEWPPPVGELIAGQEAEVRRLTARPPMPSLPPAAPGTAVTTRLGDAARAGRRRRGWRAGLLLAGVGLAVGLTALWWPRGGDEPNDPPPPDPGTAAELPPAERVTVDALGGPDRGRTFPAHALDRPEEWREWAGAFAGAPEHCALGSSLLVCRLADGTLQALAVADGSPLWQVAPADGTAPDALGPPALGGSLVLSVEGDRLVARNTATGEPYWASELPGDRPEAGGHPLTADGTVFLGVTGDEGVTIVAHALADGAELWRRPAGGPHQDGEGQPVPAVQAYGGGALFANDADGVFSLDGATGEERARNSTGAPYCADGRLMSGYLACRYPADHELAGGFHRFAANQGLAPLFDTEDFTVDTAFAPAGAGWADRAAGTPETVHAFTDTTLLSLRGAAGEEELLLRRVGSQDEEPTRYWPMPDTADGETVTPPVQVGSWAVFAAGDTLYAYDADDPRERALPLPATGDGDDPPRLLAMGGLVCLVWADGTAVSVEIP